MKKLSAIEEIALDMHSTEELMPEKKYVVDDNTIMNKLQHIQNLEQTDRDGRTLLINAAFYNRISVMEYLIRKKVNVNAKDKKGYTALHAAVQYGDVKAICLLLDNGADVNAQDFFGKPPIMVPNLCTPLQVFEVLINYGADPSLKNNYGYCAFDTYAAYPKILSILEQNKKKTAENGSPDT